MFFSKTGTVTTRFACHPHPTKEQPNEHYDLDQIFPRIIMISLTAIGTQDRANARRANATGVSTEAIILFLWACWKQKYFLLRYIWYNFKLHTYLIVYL